MTFRSERRLKIFRISSTYIIKLGQNGLKESRVVNDALPDDAHIVDVVWDGLNGCVDFIIHSESFEILPEAGQAYEVIDIVMKNVWCE
ncbi:MAG: hypothetical protein KAJ93_06080 [Methanosarcinales archaeon]|nr:hypothetical protein [Methanosarcinales archaeon]